MHRVVWHIGLSPGRIKQVWVSLTLDKGFEDRLLLRQVLVWSVRVS